MVPWERERAMQARGPRVQNPCEQSGLAALEPVALEQWKAEVRRSLELAGPQSSSRFNERS